MSGSTRARRCAGLAALLTLFAAGCLSSSSGAPDGGRERACGNATASCDGGVPADGVPGAGDAAAEDGSPDLDPARRVGRFDMSDPSAPMAEWSGSSIEAQFHGTSATVSLGGTGNYFEVVVDGAVGPVLVTDGSGSYPVASGLAPGDHDVLVFRRDEAADGPTSILGIDFGPGGQAMSAPPTPDRRIEIIGDSISAGYGDECANANTNFTPQTEDAYVAYGPVAARALGADVHVVAWSGKGLYRNLDGSTTDTMPILWERTIPTDPSSAWVPAQWVPDAVVVNLGTNDYFAQGADPSTDYEAAYVQFVATLRAAYPGALVLCTLGPMLADPQLSEQRAAITDVVSTVQAGGDPRIGMLEFPEEDCGSTGDGCGCNYHPNVAIHQAMAALLESELRSDLGW